MWCNYERSKLQSRNTTYSRKLQLQPETSYLGGCLRIYLLLPSSLNTAAFSGSKAEPSGINFPVSFGPNKFSKCNNYCLRVVTPKIQMLLWLYKRFAPNTISKVISCKCLDFPAETHQNSQVIHDVFMLFAATILQKLYDSSRKSNCMSQEWIKT